MAAGIMAADLVSHQLKHFLVVLPPFPLPSQTLLHVEWAFVGLTNVIAMRHDSRTPAGGDSRPFPFWGTGRGHDASAVLGAQCASEGQNILSPLSFFSFVFDRYC